MNIARRKVLGRVYTARVMRDDSEIALFEISPQQAVHESRQGRHDTTMILTIGIIDSADIAVIHFVAYIEGR